MKKPLVKAGQKLSATAMALSVLVAPLSYQSVMAAKPDQAGKHEVSIKDSWDNRYSHESL